MKASYHDGTTREIKVDNRRRPMLNYLTQREFEDYSSDDVDIQICLGLRTCDTIKDAMELLEDVRAHERYMCLITKNSLNKKVYHLRQK